MPARKNKITNKDSGKRNNKPDKKQGNLHVDVPRASDRAKDIDSGRRSDTETFNL
jgi:hypothetical protein